METTQVIIFELGYAPFALLVDKSRDISMKEQMAIALRYVDEQGCVIERFLLVEHVTNTTVQLLKAAIDAIFSKHGLRITSLHGQGYDGAMNIRGHLNGLKTLIQNENPTAFYVHCFAHQLQLALIAVAKKHVPIAMFFKSVCYMLNVIEGSCKRHDMLQNIQAAKVVDALNTGKFESGQGLNQKTSLKRSGDTRWGSHYSTLINLIHMFSSVIDVLEIIVKDDTNENVSSAAHSLLQLESFDFAFKIHLTTNILGITNVLSKALQRKDQVIVNAMEMYHQDAYREEVTSAALPETSLRQQCQTSHLSNSARSLIKQSTASLTSMETQPRYRTC
ncbi:zinc finger MYM-type protein 1-like protein [Cinnamomum micranthum f. kanehirae]|uniref:Zinc finger MYM-type protein 1-like protein n=1 Tax=Cinnamomum micranthum f. kanehirae TaxID=337451 RepID=A0A3S3QW31_9MAGN|nr:zinc finger MYM-type protein 1-like protein [Cinnamomum micranthum f. kanehirae]